VRVPAVVVQPDRKAFRLMSCPEHERTAPRLRATDACGSLPKTVPKRPPRCAASRAFSPLLGRAFQGGNCCTRPNGGLRRWFRLRPRSIVNLGRSRSRPRQRQRQRQGAPQARRPNQPVPNIGAVVNFSQISSARAKALWPKASSMARAISSPTSWLAKHDENYMPPEVAMALKAQGLWKGTNHNPR
jgi:hypothetical protein